MLRTYSMLLKGFHSNGGQQHFEQCLFSRSTPNTFCSSDAGRGQFPLAHGWNRPYLTLYGQPEHCAD